MVNTFFEHRVNRLFDLAEQIEKVFSAAGLEYRVAGGLAVYLYVEEAKPDAGRLTRDIDIAVRREDLEAIAAAVRPFRLEYRHVAGIDMLMQEGENSARRAVHLIFNLILGAARNIRGIRLIPLEDLVRIKLTSFRLIDQAHLKDIEEARLITPEIEANLPAILRNRLILIRKTE